MPIGALSRISQAERRDLLQRLCATQNSRCYICQDAVDLEVHGNDLEIDHIRALSSGGPDVDTNYALVHGDCNRKKLATHMDVARHLLRFERLSKACLEDKHRNPTLEDLLSTTTGSTASLGLKVMKRHVEYALSQVGDHDIRQAPLLEDPLSKVRTFFAELPLEVLYHDHRINPRSIGSNLRGLLEEFHGGRPQLHVSLAWVHTTGELAGRVHVFDGQHKAAAQILLGVKRLPVRVFVDPDLDVLLEANTNAGSKLRQVAFDKASLRNLGSSLYRERVAQYQQAHDLQDDNLNFTELELYKHFSGQKKEIKRYIADAVRHRAMHVEDNALMPFIEMAGKSTERPLSYSAIDKTFFSKFICQDPLPSPALSADPYPRDLEVRQLTELMNLTAHELLQDKYDFEVGTHKLESRVSGGESIPPAHLAAARLCREEIMHAWVSSMKDILLSHLAVTGIPMNLYEGKLLHYQFPNQAFENIRNFLINLRNLPCWSNTALSETVFGGKPNYEYWRTVFQTGKNPAGYQVLTKPLDLIEMIRPTQ